jgi:hypothetical protein
MTSEPADESMGRYGETRKVALKVMVDRPVKDALGKIRTKKSVSNLVNGLLAITIRQFDPGPSSPLIHELKELFRRHLLKAKLSGHAEEIACIEYLESQLQPYYDLAGVPANNAAESFKAEARTQSILRTNKFSRDYSWYSVPHICHGAPMAYSHKERSWICSICGNHYQED